MTDVSVCGLKKSFELGNNILDGLSFDITEGERVGILGHNGCGKTTLFRILAGELDYDEGSVSLASGRRLGLISQIPVYPDGWTTEDVLRSAYSELYRLSSRLEELAKQMESDSSDTLLREYDRISEDFRRLGGYDTETNINRVANGLDIPRSMRQQPFDSLSGGERTRVNLARLILENTEILLLDEPTNHLDLRATEWLEDYLLHFKGTVLIISHDRYFLDRVVTRCIEICDGKAEFYSGGYSFYAEERQRRFDEKLKKYEKDQAKIEQLKRAAEQMHLWAFMGNDKLHKRAFSMEKRIAKLSTTERPKEQRRLSVGFTARDFSGDEVFVCENLSKSYGDKTLFSDLSLLVEGRERIALIGDNGAGKSTLIKLIMQEETPDSGYLYRGPTVRCAYLPQIISFSDESRTLVDTMLYDCRCQPQEARDRLGAFGFRGETVFTPVGALSGGEKSRLRLCMLMGSDINLLILDEPTNHLDIASREWIEDALSGYPEALLFVSHDRYFIEKFATRIWHLKDGKITDFKGTYSEYREYCERQAVFNQAAKATAQKKAPAPKKSAPNRDKQRAKLEKEIYRLESELERLDAEAEQHSSDYTELMRIESDKAQANDRLLELYAEWEELSE